MIPSTYKAENPDCELAKYFRRDNDIVVPIARQVTFPVFGKSFRLEAHHIHHIVGQTPNGRTNDIRNMLAVNYAVHDWLHEYELAGRVLCCWELRRKGVLDFAYLSKLDRKCWPGKFETDDYARQCVQFPFVEHARIELIRKAA